MAKHSALRSPKQLVILIVLAFLIPVVTILLITKFVTGGMMTRKGDPAMSDEAVAKRLQPITMVALKEEAGKVAAAKTGEEVYKATCAACHATGALDAPKTGDKAVWAPRLKEGLEHMVEAAIKGVNQMPPRGGNPDLSDLEVARAVVYMANQSGGNFKEPEAPQTGEKVAEKSADKPVEKGAVKPADKAAEKPPQKTAEKADDKGPTTGKPAEKPQPAAAPAATAAAADGKAVYEQACSVCHATGVAQAPKTGDKEAWAPRIKSGVDALYASALQGKGTMPPKGGAAHLSDAEVKAAVDYLVQAAGP